MERIEGNSVLSRIIEPERRARYQICFRDFRDLERAMERYPLNERFIDWVAQDGYTIIYRTSLEEGKGHVMNKKITVSPQGEIETVNLVLAHELIHIAVPYKTFLPDEYREWERLIDKVALPYSQNEEFMQYAKQKIPSKTDTHPIF